MSGIAEFLERVEGYRGDRARVMWPKDIRDEAVRLLRDGADVMEMARAARITDATLRNWWKPKTPGKAIEVKVAPEPAGGIEVLIESKGRKIWIENVTEGALAKILSAA